MTDPDVVAAALARLANGDAPRPDRDAAEPSSPAPLQPRRVVADAEAAMERVPAAAAFVDADRETELRRAVDLAADRGDDELAARGRAVRSALSEFRHAAESGSGSKEGA